jgi:hypothetical protein
VAFVDVDALLVAWLPTVGVVATTYTTDDRLPSNLAYAMPLVQIVTYGGSDHDLCLDDVSLDLDVYTPTLDASKTLAEQIRGLIVHQLPGYTTSDATITRTRTTQRPAQRPYDNSAIRRVQAAYVITVHG